MRLQCLPCESRWLILTLTLTVLLDGGGGCIYLQQDLGDNGVDIEQGVQIKAQELFTRPGKPTDASGSHVGTKDKSNTRQSSILTCVCCSVPEEKSSVPQPLFSAISVHRVFITAELQVNP